MRRLFLLANAFPYGDWEPYLETELPFYGSFDQVHIFSLSVRPEQELVCRPLGNSNITVHPIRFRSSLRYMVGMGSVLRDPMFYRELAQLKRSRRFTLPRLVNLCAFLSRAHIEGGEILSTITEHSLAEPGDAVVLYSYRLAYQPYISELVSRHLAVRHIKVARAHGSDLYEEASPIGYIPLRTRTLEVLDAVYPVSDHGYRYLSERHPWAANRLKVSHLGTHDHGLAPAPRSRNPLRLVTCSSMVPVKRIDRLVRALALIRDRAVVWTHFGDGPLRVEIESMARDMCGNNITLDFRGSVANQQVLSAYVASPFHALVNLSDSEGIPVSMMEACSFGIPIISTDVGGVGEIVKHGANGLLLSSRPSIADILHVISELAEMSDTAYETLRQGARHAWTDKFDATTNYTQFVVTLMEASDHNASGGL